MKSRVVVVFLALITIWCTLLGRGLYLQVFENQKLEAQKKRQFSRKIAVNGRRGRIFDRQGKELSVSLTTYSLFADPKLLESSQKTSRKISRLLKMPYRSVLKKVANKKRRFVWLKRNLSKELRDEIRTWKNRGLGFIEEPKRVYPNGALGSQVIGSVNRDERGIEGLERRFDSILKGKSISLPMRRDARGRPLLLNGEWKEGRIDGFDLVTTIDRDLQFYAEEELKRVSEKYQADSAVAVILEAKSSEVLTMANYPTFDPQANSKKAWSKWQKNRAVTDSFEPGSTMKTMLIASALDKIELQPGKKYFCENGKFKIGRRTIREADSRHHYGWLTVNEILSKSSNIGTSKISFDLTDGLYRETLVDLGFGQKSGIHFPGEARGILHKLPWRPHLLANVSFGHGVSSSPLQMALAYATIARGGVWKPPVLVKHVQDSIGNKRDLNEFEGEWGLPASRRVFSEETAKNMTIMLTAVTGVGGTGLKARVPGFLVAGKTGTAQKVNPKGKGYLHGAYISSFAGFVPAHDPKYVIYIALDNPKKAYYGSAVAAPIFASLASYALLKDRVEPVLLSENNLLQQRDTTSEKVRSALKRLSSVDQRFEKVPRLTGLTMREVVRQLGAAQIDLQFEGRGVVVATEPKQGQKLASDKRLKVIFSSNN